MHGAIDFENCLVIVNSQMSAPACRLYAYLVLVLDTSLISNPVLVQTLTTCTHGRCRPRNPLGATHVGWFFAQMGEASMQLLSRFRFKHDMTSRLLTSNWQTIKPFLVVGGFVCSSSNPASLSCSFSWTSLWDQYNRRQLKRSWVDRTLNAGMWYIHSFTDQCTCGWAWREFWHLFAYAWFVNVFLGLRITWGFAKSSYVARYADTYSRQKLISDIYKRNDYINYIQLRLK